MQYWEVVDTLPLSIGHYLYYSEWLCKLHTHSLSTDTWASLYIITLHDILLECQTLHYLYKPEYFTAGGARTTFTWLYSVTWWNLVEIFKRKGNYSGAYLNDVLTVFKQNLKSCAGLQKAVTKRWYLVLLSRDHFQVRFRREPCTDHGHNRVMFPHFSAKTLKLIL